LTLAGPPSTNDRVTRRSSTIVHLRVLLLILSVATANVAEWASSSKAMACCAKTHNRCAGLKSPDDCCKGMGHSIASATVATVKALKVSAAPDLAARVAPPETAFDQATGARAARENIKRPHDPPHLHTFPLLI